MDLPVGNILKDSIAQPFSKRDFPGEREGRALLEYCRQHSLTKENGPGADEIIKALAESVRDHGYFGPELDMDAIDEGQLAGNGWFLRGLMAFYKLFQLQQALELARRAVDRLFFPVTYAYSAYPMERNCETVGNWRLSPDVGCAFTAIEGMSCYYEVTRDKSLEMSLAYVIWQFMRLEKLGLNMESGAVLAAARGILKYGEISGDQEYLIYLREMWKRREESSMDDGPGGQGPCSGGSLPGYRP